MGDLAMLQVAVCRLQRALEDPSIFVYTNAPDLLARYCPGTRPLDPECSPRSGFGVFPVRSWMPFESQVNRFNAGLNKRHPHWGLGAAVIKKSLLGKDFSVEKTAVGVWRNLDILVAQGMGMITDPFRNDALRLLQDFQIATRTGVRTAMFGQGLGPVHDPDLLKAMAEVLPHVDQIALREGLAGPKLAKAVGVPESRLAVTGDDAIDLAYPKASCPIGSCLGVNVRVAGYSGVAAGHVQMIQESLRRVLDIFPAELIPVPISLDRDSSDLRALSVLLGEDLNASSECFDEPAKVIRQIGKCRVTVTGSYHGAVFSLAQGIPVVGLSHSEYYDHKFIGLKHQFGCGVELVRFDTPELSDNLCAAILRAWDSAEQLRGRLLAAADEQVQSSKRVYDHFLSGLALR